jgi:hypothetical protein
MKKLTVIMNNSNFSGIVYLQVFNYCSSSSRGKYTIGNTTLNAISSVVDMN